MALTPKQESFAQAVASGKTQADAYRAAFNASKMKAETIQKRASELMARGEVRGRVKDLIAKVSSGVVGKAVIDRTWVMDQLVEVVSMAKASEPVLDSDGNPVGEYKTNLAAANKALELIGKEFAMFVDRKEVRTGPLDGLKHDELKALHDAIETISNAGRTVAPGVGGTVH